MPTRGRGPPRRPPSADDDVRTRARLCPVIWDERYLCPPPPESGAARVRPLPRRRQHEHRALAGRGHHEVRGTPSRRDAQHVGAGPPRPLRSSGPRASPTSGTCGCPFPPVSALRERSVRAGSSRTTARGDAVTRNERRRPAHRHDAHGASSTTSAGGPQPMTLSIGSKDERGPRLCGVSSYPAPHLAAVERDAHHDPARMSRASSSGTR